MRSAHRRRLLRSGVVDTKMDADEWRQGVPSEVELISFECGISRAAERLGIASAEHTFRNQHSSYEPTLHPDKRGGGKENTEKLV